MVENVPTMGEQGMLSDDKRVTAEFSGSSEGQGSNDDHRDTYIPSTLGQKKKIELPPERPSRKQCFQGICRFGF